MRREVQSVLVRQTRAATQVNRGCGDGGGGGARLVQVAVLPLADDVTDLITSIRLEALHDKLQQE